MKGVVEFRVECIYVDEVKPVSLSLASSMDGSPGNISYPQTRLDGHPKYRLRESGPTDIV